MCSICDFTVQVCSLCDVFLYCKVVPSLVVAEGAIFGGEGCDRNDTLVTEAVFETTLVSGAWGGG